MSISIFDLFSTGIGPSSSHTMGPMRAAGTFIKELQEIEQLNQVNSVIVELYGSLALTGIGHGTDKAIILGLEGYQPETIDPTIVVSRFRQVEDTQLLALNNEKVITFNTKKHLLFFHEDALQHHSNGMRFFAFNADNTLILEKTFYSIGGGFIVDNDKPNQESDILEPLFPFHSAAELLGHCEKNQLRISKIMLANEAIHSDEQSVKQKIHTIIDAMEASIERGFNTQGILPGGLNVTRRAPALYQKLTAQHNTDQMMWLNLFALAVNEENANGGRIVTAPTNGAAGIIPAVLSYYKKFYDDVTDESIEEFMLTAGAIAILYKKGASISGAEVGCQGEVGVASSMAAGALVAALGGTLSQIEDAAEIAMEHHLGMTCDPVGGLVQIPCIERNAMGAVKAVNAAQLALVGEGTHVVSLDQVIATMKQTGLDMMTHYKETSQAGLAVNVVAC